MGPFLRHLRPSAIEFNTPPSRGQARCGAPSAGRTPRRAVRYLQVEGSLAYRRREVGQGAAMPGCAGGRPTPRRESSAAPRRGSTCHGDADRRLCDDRRLSDGRPGGPRRVDRLAVRPPVRLGGVLRGPAGHARERPMEDRAGRVGRGPGRVAAVPAGLDGSGDRVRHRLGRRADHRRHGDRQPDADDRASGRGVARRGPDAVGADRPVRLRMDRPLGDGAPGGDHGDRRARPAEAAVVGRASRGGVRHRRRLRHQGGAEGPVHAGVASVQPSRHRPVSMPRARSTTPTRGGATGRRGATAIRAITTRR